MTHGTGASTPVSLVMPNRDNAAVLGVVLDRLAAHTTHTDVELVVVDDGSTDGSLELLRQFRDQRRFPGEVHLLEREHRGVVEALNEGLRTASGDVVVQLDADASIETPGWLERMLALLTLDDRVGVVTAKVVLDTGLVHALGVNIVGPEGLHDRGTTIDEPIGARTAHSRVRRPREGTSPLEDHAAEVDSGIGCCMMYRREAALAAGGYDPGFAPVWFDDLDLCLAIRREGLKAFYLPEVRVLHRVTERHGPPSPRARALGAARRRAGALVPPPMREPLARRLGLDRPDPVAAERLRSHARHWRAKWGWDLVNPDMAAVEQRFGGTEVCWATDPARRAAGEAILARHGAGR